MPAATQSGMLEWMKAAGFDTNPLWRTARSVEELLAFHHEIGLRRAELPYDIDGVVYKVDRLDWQERLGFVSRNPRWAAAHQVSGREGHDGSAWHRYPGWTHGRTDSCGAARAGHRRWRRRAERHASQRRVHQDAGRSYRRHGDDPARGRRDPAGARRRRREAARRARLRVSSQVSVPLKTEVIREATATGEEGAIARCTGEFACPFQKTEHLRHFVSRLAFDIEGLGEKQIQFFFEKEWVQEPADIFTLQSRNENGELKGVEQTAEGVTLTHSRLEEFDGFGETSVGKLFAAINERRARFHSSGSSTPWASGTLARRPLARWRAATARGRRSTTRVSASLPMTPMHAPRWMISTRSAIP